VCTCVHWEFEFLSPPGPLSYCFAHCVALLFDYLPTPAVRDFPLSSWTVDLCWSIECSHYLPLDSQRMLQCDRTSEILLSYRLSAGLVGLLQPSELRLQGRSSPAVDVVAPRNRRYVLTQINSIKKERLDDFSLLSHRYSHLSFLDHLICDVDGLGKPVIGLSVGVYPPPDCAALLSRYPRIVSDLRVRLSKYQHLRRGRPCAR